MVGIRAAADADVALDDGVPQAHLDRVELECRASSSSSDSSAKAAVGAPGARYAPKVKRFVCTP